MIHITYFSVLSSERLINALKERTGRDPGYAVQKFNRLVVKGLIENGARVEVASVAPVDRTSLDRLIFNVVENENGIGYKYLPFINLAGIKQLCVFWGSFFKVLKAGLFKRNNYAVVCDALSISSSMGAVWASRICGVKVVGILTDMPGMMVSSKVGHGNFLSKLKKKVVTKLNKSYLEHFTHYVFLTEQMNEVINRKNRPYIVMEGLCNPEYCKTEQLEKFPYKTIMYAGGLHERYGLKKLTEAFMALEDSNVRFLVYGAGPYSSELEKCAQSDNRIIYKGLAPNNEVVAAELQSTLLVNPRPTDEEFTKYSFPSKNMEYMVSGTPLLTTRLPGIPGDYNTYLYFIEDESLEGYISALRNTLSKPDTELAAMGQSAKQWVIDNKNYIVQASRILSLLAE